jgi:hypothetical protein
MSKTVYLPHVFLRYSQRVGVRKTGIDLIKHYFEHNHYGESSNDKRFVGKSVRYNDKDNIGVSVEEGVLFGEQKEDTFVAKTFITYDMATGGQRLEFEDKKTQVLQPHEIIDTLKQQYQNRNKNIL